MISLPRQAPNPVNAALIGSHEVLGFDYIAYPRDRRLELSHRDHPPVVSRIAAIPNTRLTQMLAPPAARLRVRRGIVPVGDVAGVGVDEFRRTIPAGGDRVETRHLQAGPH